MYVQKLYLRSFRNYDEACIELIPGTNLFYGENAQGKTNLLEALNFCIAGRSFRTPKTSELISYEAKSFDLEVHFVKHEIEQVIRITYGGKKRLICHNSTEYTSFIQLVGLIQGVVLTPDDMELINASAQLRRQFLDLQIAQVDPLYVHHLTRYLRALKQRNILLRNKALLGIESWEHELSASAAYVCLQRRRALGVLKNLTETLYYKLGGGSEKLLLEYRGLIIKEESLESIQKAYIHAYNRYRNQEVYMGYSLVGPHRDDFTMKMDGVGVKDFASEGQKRTLVAALRFAEWAHLYQESGEMPIMSVDDIGLSLDTRRKQKLYEHLITLGQVFVTSPEELSKEYFPTSIKV
ncbi:MAG: DNA replication and repair protein RecF [Chlamydiales bacterium]|nr:DNA replication and repair protein RecF [Chlamydiales bacterium]